MDKECAILGVCWSYIPVIADYIEESFDVKTFNIHKNIHTEGQPLLFNNSDKIIYNIYEPFSFDQINGNYVVFGASWPKAKFYVFKDFAKQNMIDKSSMSNYIHNTAYLAKSVQYQTGLFIEPGVVISSQTKIGFSVTLKRSSSIGHHNIIGDYCDIHPGVVTASQVNIGRGTIISTGCKIGSGVTIGKNVYIGMGSTVNKDIPDGVVAYGNPCKVIRDNNQWEI